MCTATWLSEAEGYQLFFSRDEARDRAPARPPERHVWDGVHVLAPIDGAAGGTWLAANEFGLAVCLLNASTAYGPLDPAEGVDEPRSRGLLVRDMASSASEAELEDRLSREPLERYRGFRLGSFAPSRDAAAGTKRLAVRVWAWDGSTLREEVVRQPLASSSLGSERAHAERGRTLGTFGLPEATEPAEDARPEDLRNGFDRGGALEAFHRSHAPERGPWSVCVHRAEVTTLSLCHVRVDAGRVGLRYAAGSPCESAFGPETSLARRVARPAS